MEEIAKLKMELKGEDAFEIKVFDKQREVLVAEIKPRKKATAIIEFHI